MTFLPYHCPTFRTDHLQEPCQKNLARVKALKEAHKHVGPLEKCMECRGKMLTKAEEPAGYVSPEQKGWEPVPEVTTAPLFLKDVYHPAPEEPKTLQLSPEKIKKTREAVQRMAERFKVGKKPPKKEEILPELPKSALVPGHDHGEFAPFTPKQEEIVQEVAKEVDIGPGKEIFTKQEAISRGIMPPDGTVEPRYCPTHPEKPQKIDRLGRFMGMCTECLAIRGKKCGVQNFERGVTAPPVSIPLNLERYSELKAWLIAKADDECRTLQMQIIHILREAWRQGT
jgi:hypothetical protein